MKSTARKTLSKLSLSLYAFASLGGGMTDFPIAIFLIPFYSEVIGLSPALIGWLALIPGIYDAFTDPFSVFLTGRGCISKTEKQVMRYCVNNFLNRHPVPPCGWMGCSL